MNTTLDDLFDYLLSDPQNNVAPVFLTITSGTNAGIYAMDLKFGAIPKKPGSVQAVPSEEIVGSWTRPTSRYSNESISLTIVRPATKALTGHHKHTYHVEVDHLHNLYGRVTSGKVAAFTPDLSAPRTGPCQTSAYFQSLETPVSLVQCCIP